MARPERKDAAKRLHNLQNNASRDKSTMPHDDIKHITELYLSSRKTSIFHSFWPVKGQTKMNIIIILLQIHSMSIQVSIIIFYTPHGRIELLQYHPWKPKIMICCLYEAYFFQKENIKIYIYTQYRTFRSKTVLRLCFLYILVQIGS